MGICSFNDDRNKKLRESNQDNPITNGETRKEIDLNNPTEIGKVQIINRLSNRTKFKNINNDYIISERILGKGATGIVREAEDKNGNKYAIKTVWKSDIEQNECFKKEIDITLELNHEAIVKCIDIYEDNTTINLVLEEITGGDLFDYIIHSNGRKLSEMEAMDLLLQMLEGLHYLHSEIKIVHRDIKPENFLIYNDCAQKDKNNTDNKKIVLNKNKIKLIDFGFATYCKEGETMTEQLGTPQYAAPEIFEQKPYTSKVDLWSVGIVLYNMINGTQPFASRDIEKIKDQVLHKEINFNGFNNRQLKELCQSLLERDPNKRYSAFQAKSFLKLIMEDKTNEDTVAQKFAPKIGEILSILYNDRTIIEELKNIFLSECSPDELNNMFHEILSLNSREKEERTDVFVSVKTTYDMVSEKLYLKAEKIIEYAQHSKYAPENLKTRLKKYSEQKIIDKIKKQMINVDNFFFTLIESIKFIRKTRCLNEFTKMDKNNMGWLSAKQINNYFIDPIKRHNIKTKINPYDKIEFETFYKIFNEYNGIKYLNFNKKK